MAPSTTKTATPKSKTTGAGVIKKRAGNPKGRPVGKGKAGQAMAKMQAYCKSLCEAVTDAFRCSVASQRVLHRVVVTTFTTQINQANALQVKENRGKYEGLDYKGQQKKLGEDVSIYHLPFQLMHPVATTHGIVLTGLQWKKSPENPKNST